MTSKEHKEILLDKCNVLYLDCYSGYMTVKHYQNLSFVHLQWVNFILYQHNSLKQYLNKQTLFVAETNFVPCVQMLLFFIYIYIYINTVLLK